MEVNESNEDIRRRAAIFRQKLDLIEMSAARYSPHPETRKQWERLKKKAEKRLSEIDDALCRTEIITKFDLMEFD